MTTSVHNLRVHLDWLRHVSWVDVLGIFIDCHIYLLGESLTLYVHMNSTLTKLWSHTMDGLFNQWRKFEVELPSELEETYQFIFKAQYVQGCTNSVGLDEIEFHLCPVGKFEHDRYNEVGSSL